MSKQLGTIRILDISGRNRFALADHKVNAVAEKFARFPEHANDNFV
jgi:hypothetical protein